MARGLLTGLIWGSVISVGGAAVVSLSTPLPQPPNVASTAPGAIAPAPNVPQAPQTDTAQSDIAATPQKPAEPQVPQTDDLAALDTSDTVPAPAPDIGTAQELEQPTAAVEDAPRVSVTTDDTTRAAEPQAPSGTTDDQTPAIADAPSTPAPIEADRPADTATADTDEPASAALANTQTSGSGSSQVQQIAQEADPAATPAPDETASPSSAAEDTTAPDASGSGTTALSQEDEAAAEAAAVAGLVQPSDTAPTPQASPTQPVTDEAAPTPRIAALPRVEPSVDTDTLVPTVGQRAVPLTDRQSGTAALPTITPDAPVTSDQSTSEPVQEATDPAVPLRPIEQFAAPFDNSEGKPLMGIVLIDDEGAFGAEALASFPYALSFAVDPLDPQAKDKMARYREAGFEVLTLLDLPEQANAQDAETILEVGLSMLNESIGVLEGTQSGIQGNRALSDQVTAILRDRGYGLVTQNEGLNTVQKLAAREGVPSAYVFRDFDGAGQTPTVMRRFLDQAAFRAAQEGGVIMLGRVQPDTISALLLWGLQDRASRVNLAPVSAVLLNTAQAE